MVTRELGSAPKILPLYARTVAPLLPGASLLPFLGGRGGELPELELALARVRVDPDRLAAYAHVCGFSLRDALPATYPHVLAFPLHLALMADRRFPFPAVGLVHVANRIVQHRPIELGEALDLRVRTTPLRAHPRGRAFALVSEVRADEELVWEDHSTMLRRGAGAGAGGEELVVRDELPPQSAVWRLSGDLGRRYATVSGDRNPIHMHALSAKAFGFPRAIAHGMWTKARCLAALEQRLPDSFEARVDFRRPILLPGAVVFGAEEIERGAIRFAVSDSEGASRHLDGRVASGAAGADPTSGAADENIDPAARARARACARGGVQKPKADTAP